jgi:hypothetical protein
MSLNREKFGFSVMHGVYVLLLRIADSVYSLELLQEHEGQRSRREHTPPRWHPTPEEH